MQKRLPEEQLLIVREITVVNRINSPPTHRAKNISADFTFQYVYAWNLYFVMVVTFLADYEKLLLNNRLLNMYKNAILSEICPKPMMVLVLNGRFNEEISVMQMFIFRSGN